MIYASLSTYQLIIAQCAFRRTAGLLLTVLLGSVLGFSQSQQDLQKKQARLATNIQKTTELLKNSSKSKEAALDRLVILQRQIVQRQRLTILLSQQVELADQSLARTNDIMSSMQADIDTLTAEYGRMARAALRQNIMNGRMAFLLSSRSINEAFARALYLRQYDENRRRRLSLISSTQKALSGKMNKLDALRQEKEAVLLAEQEQQQLLEQELESKNLLILELKEDEQRLRTQLQQQQKAKQALDNAISDVINSTQKASQLAEKNRNATPTSGSTQTIRPTKEPRLSSNFLNNKGKLPPPVDKGYITKPYGQHAHPTLARVKINNNGVDIRTDLGATVKAVFDGEVVGIQSVPGYNYMVIIQHDDYYSVYSNLVDIRVKIGAKISTAEAIGKVAVDESTRSSDLHFEVWQNRTTQNPVRWITDLK